MSGIKKYLLKRRYTNFDDRNSFLISKIGLLILIIVFPFFLNSKAFAYLKNYPPFRFKDDPQNHLKVKQLVDLNKSEFQSTDGKVLVRLKNTTGNFELLIRDGKHLLENKESEDMPKPFAVYWVDLDGNGLKDFIVFYNYRDLFNGVKADKVEIFLKKSGDSYQSISYETIAVGLEDFVDLNNDGKYEVIISDRYLAGGKNYFTYNIYEFKNYKLSNVDKKFINFPKFIWNTFKANDKNSLALADEERLLLTEKKNRSVRSHEVVAGQKDSSPNGSVRNKDEAYSEEGTNANQTTNAEVKESREMLEARVKALLEALELKDKALKALEDKKRKLKIRFENKDREFLEALEANDKEHQEEMEARVKELKEAIARKDKALKALKNRDRRLKSEPEEVLEAKVKELTETVTQKDKELNKLKDEEKKLKAALEAKDKELKEVIAAKEQEFQVALEAKIREFSEKNLTSLEAASGDESLLKIFVVDIQRVIEESNKGKEARKFFEGLISLRSDEEMAKIEQDLVDQIFKDITIIIEEYAEIAGFTHVIDMLEGGVIYNEEKFDITDEIIELYNKKVEIPAKKSMKLK